MGRRKIRDRTDTLFLLSKLYIKNSSQNQFYSQINKSFRTIFSWSETWLIIPNSRFREAILSFGIRSKYIFIELIYQWKMVLRCFVWIENNCSVSKLPHHRKNIDLECDFPQEMFPIYRCWIPHSKFWHFCTNSLYRCVILINIH